MARTLTGYVVDMQLTESAAALYGALSWPAGQRDLLSWETVVGGARGMQLGREPMGDRVALRPAQWGRAEYTVGAAWFGGYARTVPAVKSWRAFCLLASVPAGTSVGVLLQDGAGAWRRWTGAAWVATDPAVPANWNTEAEVQAGIRSWSGTYLRPWYRLATTVAKETPRVFGCRLVCRIWAPGGYAEEMLLSVVLARLSDLQVPVRLAVPASGLASVDLSTLREYAFTTDEGLPAFVPVSVHDRTADPSEAAELIASWNPATHIVALSSAPTAGNRLIVDATVTPLAARVTSDDYFEPARLPAVLVDGVRLRAEGWGAQPRVVVQSGVATVLPRPTPYHASLDLTVAAGYDADVQAAVSAVDRLATGPVYSETTGEASRLIRTGEWEERGELGASSTWDLYGFIGYSGLDADEQAVLTVEPEPVSL